MSKNIDKGLINTWENLGQSDPLWAILMNHDKKGGKWELEEFFNEGKTDVDNLMNDIRKLEVRVPGNKALDFGCGVGRLSQALCEYFNEVCGVDVSEPMIEFADRYNRFPEKCSYYLNTADDLSIFESGSFDLVLTLITLQHMKPQLAKKYLMELLRLLSVDGLLVFQLPSHIKKNIISKKTTPVGIPQKTFDWLERNMYDKLPGRIRAIIRRLKYFVFRLLKKPAVEMYGIKKDKVIRLLEAAGAKVIDVRENSRAGHVWVSYTYYVKK